MKIHAEQGHWRKHGSGKELDAIECTFAVWNACSAIGVDFNQMIAAIYT
jgi:hypothetical protein